MLKAYKSDVLLCLADLSNDEVFTPPTIANRMLDLLPRDIWANPDIKILDPAAKSGVFLREAAKRMLNAQVPNFQKNLDEIEERKKDGKALTQKQLQFQEKLQDKINHIFMKQLFALPITELTALLTRRSVYCSKDAMNEHSVVQGFDDRQGNMRFFADIHHQWENGKCKSCGASAKTLDREDGKEQHAYAFIHYEQLVKKWSEIKDMHFDVIIGNPPYQLSDGGGTGSSAMPIYHLFVEQAKKLNPDYLVMITPSRWFAGGRGLDNFRDEMLNDKRISTIVDYINSNDVFPGVDISGGISYFLWNKNHNGDCIVRSMERREIVSELKRPLKEKNSDSFIRFNIAVSIIHKIQKFDEESFSSLIYSHKPFGIRSFEEGKSIKHDDSVILHTSKGIQYIGRKKIKQNQDAIDKYKVYISKAYGERISSNFWVVGKPFLGEPNTACTETYLLIGTFADKQTCENVMSYIKTRFFRFLVLLKKNTQNTAKGTYQFVPQQDFSKSWTDKELYQKYGLDNEEIAFIEKMVREME